MVAARYCLQQKCILFIAVTSRCRHESEAPSPSRHRCRVRVVRVNKKTMPDKTPAPAFSLPHTTLRVRLGRCAFCLIAPAHPACQAARGRAALRLSRSPAMLPIRPKVLPKIKTECRFFQASVPSCSSFLPCARRIAPQAVWIPVAGEYRCASASLWVWAGTAQACLPIRRVFF